MDGENRIVTGWIGVIAGSIFLIIISSTPGDSDAIPGCCCFLILFCLLLQSGYEQKKKAQNQMVYIPQPIQQQVIHHTHTYTPPQVIQQPTPRPKPRPLGASPVKNTPKKKLGTSTHKYPDTPPGWAQKAKNLELARDWVGAADAFQKAGLYAEAGRIRQQYMEKDESGVNIQIQGGDTIHDSVIMRDDDSNL